MTITADTLRGIPANAIYVIYDTYHGVPDDAMFPNNAIGREAAARLYNGLNCPFKKITYETAHGDVDLYKTYDSEHSAWLYGDK